MGEEKLLCIYVKHQVYDGALSFAMGPGNRSRHLHSDHMLVVRFVETWTELRESMSLTLPSQNVTMTESQQETESRVPWSSANLKSLKAKDLDF